MDPFQRGRSWAGKFRDAWVGLGQGMQGQKSFYVHLPMAVAVVLAGVWLQVSIMEFSILLLCIAMVLVLELVNSSLEAMSRAITDQYNESLGKALNIASAAVLLASLFSAVVGLLILGSKLIEWTG
ncbi:MAG: diacylglycerol kinase family protein [Mariniblastus sp.]|nr:diacylglycerol kinase family protein [Mariniblastus sp.]